MNTKCTVPFHRKLPILLWLALAGSSLVALNGCAAIQNRGKVEHGFNVKNVGAESIQGVSIRYGDVQVPFCQTSCRPKRGDGGWFAPMAIEENMEVTWNTADGEKRVVHVPVKARAKDLRRLRVLILEFNKDQLTVLQGMEQATPGLAGWELAPLYP